MAVITIQELQDAAVDAGTVETFSNGTPQMVTPRYGVPFPNMPKLAADFRSEFDASQVVKSAEFEAFLEASGYVDLGNYDDGPILVQHRNEIFMKDGELWKAAASLSLPYTTVSNWATDNPKFVSVGDAALRQELASSVGSTLVKNQQSGSGSVLRTLQNKFAEMVSILDKGGSATPGFDNAAALLLAGASTTGLVLIPGGTFEVTLTPANSADLIALVARLRIEGNVVYNVATGAHTFTVPATGAYNANKFGSFKIIGPTPVALSITGQVSVSGGAGNYSVVLGVSTIAGIAVGDWLHTVQVAGTGVPEAHRGIWEITNVDAVNTRITVRNTIRSAAFPTNTITSSTSSVLKAALKFNNCDGFVVNGSRIDFFDNLAVVGNADSYWSSANVTGTEKGTHGFAIGSQTVAVNGKADNANQYGVSLGHVSFGPNVGISGFDQQGIVTELGGTFWGDFLSSCNNKRRGVYISTGSSARAKHISSNGNYLDGAICDIGGNLYSSSVSCAIGNGQRGVTSSQGSTLVFDSGIMSYNGSDGAGAVLGGTVQATSARFEFNGGAGVLGDYGGTAVVNNSQMTGNTRYGIDAGFNVACRALSCVINNNTLQGVRSTELAVMVVTGTTFSGNVLGDKTTRGDGMILDGSTYTLAARIGTLFKAIPTATNAGVQMASTSGGDDFIVSHDTTGGGTFVNAFHVRANNAGIYPDSDNLASYGRASNRASVIYAGTGTINTSDAREKTEVVALTAYELQAAAALAKEVGTFRWLASVQAKGEDARLHIGMTVQRAIEIMESFGLDAMSYGFICYDSWDAEEPEVVIDDEGETREVSSGREAGNRYAFRMDQLLMFIAAGQEHRLTKLEALLNA